MDFKHNAFSEDAATPGLITSVAALPVVAPTEALDGELLQGVVADHGVHAFDAKLADLGIIKSHKDLAHFETAYVVKLHSVARLAPSQPVFTFTHPNYSIKKSNQRYKKFQFEVPNDTGSALVHGYFDATLYKDVHLGIEPSTATPNMFSWYMLPSSQVHGVRFPVFIPLRTPVCIRPGSPLEAHLWRFCGSTKYPFFGKPDPTIAEERLARAEKILDTARILKSQRLLQTYMAVVNRVLAIENDLEEQKNVDTKPFRASSYKGYGNHNSENVKGSNTQPQSRQELESDVESKVMVRSIG
ncbi:hypothetical protein RJ639_011742 [Escallonia herrerae]|uniref:PRMT5 oligomerisation domain-containing protein n=1 Tax=Escallonia herrerae TaxID=1293975 RepID=A0AA88VPY5_9ASTE|nr:hypothetical protein RJ639_011742 [Escallonia herrerae]